MVSVWITVGVPGVVACLIAAVATSGCAGPESSGANHPLRVGTTGDHAPYSEAIGDAFVGIDIDLARDLAESLGRPIEFVRATWPSLLPDLARGRYHIAMSGIHITEERKRDGDFSLPYLAVGTQALVRCDEVDRFPTLNEVNRAEVQVLSTLGGANHRFVRDHTPEAAIRPVVGASDTFERLAEGEGHLAFGNSLRIHHAARSDPRLCIGLRGQVYDVHSVGILVNEQFVDLGQVNLWIEQRMRDRVIEQVVGAHTNAL